jgi:hypothetical protein
MTRCRERGLRAWVRECAPRADSAVPEPRDELAEARA